MLPLAALHCTGFSYKELYGLFAGTDKWPKGLTVNGRVQ